MSVKVYGSSDDLIEVEGDIREEFNVYNTPVVLAFSNGAVFRVKYEPRGVWRITPSYVAGIDYEITQAPEDDDDNYSDIAEIPGDVMWVVVGEDFAVANR